MAIEYEKMAMRRLNYPGLQTHVEQHNTLLSKLGSTAELIANYSLTMANLESFLSAWLLNHPETLGASLVGHCRTNTPVA